MWLLEVGRSRAEPSPANLRTHELALQVKCPLAFVSLHVKLRGDGIHTTVSLTLASLSYPQGGWGPGWGWAQEGTGSELRSVHSKACEFPRAVGPGAQRSREE